MSQKVASLYAEITAKTTGFDQAIAQTKRGMSQVQTMARQMSNSASADARNMAKAMTAPAVSMQQSANATMTWGQQFKAQIPVLKQVGMAFAKVGVAAAAIGYAGKQVYNFSKAGAELEYTQIRFDRLSNSVGTTSDMLLNRLRNATKGTVSDFGLAQQAADMFQLGLADTADEAIRLSKVQTALGMDTGELTLALANQSTKRLDQLGLSLAKFNEIKATLKSTTGLTDAALFKEAFLQTAEKTVLTTGNMADTNLGQFQKLEAQWANLTGALKESFGGAFAPVVGGVAESLGGYNEAQRIREMYKNSAQYKPMTLPPGKGGGGIDALAQNWYKRQQVAARMQQGKDDTYISKTAAVDATTNYKAIISSGYDLTKINKEVAATQAQINEQFTSSKYVYGLYRQAAEEVRAELSNGTISASEFNQKMKDLGESYADGTFAANQQREAMNQLADEAGKAYDDLLAKALDQKDATDDIKTAYALASGQITQGAANQAQAISKIADAINDGSISASEAAGGLDRMMSTLERLNGKGANMYIDIFIREHGRLPVFMSQEQMDNRLANKLAEGPVSGLAGGGFLTDATLVGDAPGGVLTPYSELILGNKYVLDSKTTHDLAKAGLLKGVNSHAWTGPLDGGGSGGIVVTSSTGKKKKPGRTTTTTSKGETIPTPTASEDIVVPAVVAAVQQEVNATQQRAIRQATQTAENSAQQVALLRAMLAKMATAPDIGRAVVGQGNKWNG